MTRRRVFYVACAVFGLALVSTGCTEKPPSTSSSGGLTLPADPTDYAPIEQFQAMTIPDDNPMTAEKAALGWQLFFDKRLSGDGSRSCYSCHLNEKGLSDGRPTAIGAFEKKLTRNSPTLWNIGYHDALYWDGRAGSLEKQAAAAWKGGNMGAKEKVADILAKLNSIKGYKDQFQKVFGEGATEENIPKALSAYMRTIISKNTPYDKWQAGDQSALDDAAKRGYAVFKKAKCDNCHSGILFTDMQFHNVGIGMDVEKPDIGRLKATKLTKDKGAFKTPTLRDVVNSGPYFHDGSVADLREAVKILLNGGKENPHLDRANLQKVTPPLTEKEIDDLLEFLKALEEPTTLEEPKIPS